MRIGLFTDSHYSSKELTCGKRKNSEGLIRMAAAFEHFLQEKCDLIVCLGDLIDKEESHEKETENLKKVSDFFSNINVPIYAVMGNHDAFAFEVDEFYSVLGEEYRPKNTQRENTNLIFLDACYFKSGEHYHIGDTDWTDTFLPEEKEIQRVLDETAGDIYLFVHQNLDPEIPENHRIFNDKAIRAILEKNGRVKTVFQGHYHDGNEREINGINYKTLAALCENKDSYCTIEI